MDEVPTLDRVFQPEAQPQPQEQGFLRRAGNGIYSVLSSTGSVIGSTATKPIRVAGNATVQGLVAALPGGSVEGLIEQIGITISEEVSAANEQLSDFTSLLNNLYKQLKTANNREGTLWSIIEVQNALDSLLTGDNTSVIQRLQQMFVVPDELRLSKTRPKPPKVDLTSIEVVIARMKVFKERLALYKDILEGKEHASKKELTSLRLELARWLKISTSEDGEEPVERIETPLVVESDRIEEFPLDEQRQIVSHLQNPPHPIDPKEAYNLTGLGILDFFLEIKLQRQGKWVNGIENLGETLVGATARKASELWYTTLGMQSSRSIACDDIDTPPIQDLDIVIIKKSTLHADERIETRIQRRNILARPLSIGRLIEIFTGYVAHNESNGMYEIWGKSLTLYFTHLVGYLKEEHAAHPPGASDRNAQRQYDKTLQDIERSIQLLNQTFSVANPTTESVQETFRVIGNLMNEHPLLVLHGVREFDLGKMLGADALTDQSFKSTMQRIREGIQKAQREETTTLKTPEEEKATFNLRLEEAGELGHLFSLYTTVATLLGGDLSSRIKFHEIYSSIPKSRNGTNLSPKKICELFEEKLRTELIDNAGDTWIITRWFLKLLLPIISWGIHFGISRAVSEAKEQIALFVNELKPGKESTPETTLVRLEAAAKCISRVVKDDGLREKLNGPYGVYKEGLLKGKHLDTGSSDSTPKQIYDTFTNNVIDQYMPPIVTCVEAINKFDLSISNTIDKINFSPIRILLSTASMAIRIPLWGISFIFVRPIQNTINWSIKTGTKKFLRYIGIVENAMEAAKSGLQEERAKRTGITPIIDRSVLELLQTLWTSLHTNEAGELVETSEIDFQSKTVTTPQRRQKQKNAQSALFQAVQDIQNMNTNADRAVPAPFISDIMNYVIDRARDLGLDASSDITVAALNTLTQPKMFYHMLSTGLDAVNSSLKESGTELDLTDDDEVRRQISEMVERLVALSIHRAGDFVREKDLTCNENIQIHIEDMKHLFLQPALVSPEPLPGDLDDEFATPSASPIPEGEEVKSDMIHKWSTIISDYTEDTECDAKFKKMIGIRKDLFSIFKSLQADIIRLENDKTTSSASLNVHKRQLDKLISALLKFQDDYLKIYNRAICKKFSQTHEEELKQLDIATHAANQVAARLNNCRIALETSGEIGEISSADLDGCAQEIQRSAQIFLDLKATFFAQSTESSELTDSLMTLITTAENQFYYLKELHKHLSTYKETAEFVKTLLGEEVHFRPTEQQESLEAIILKSSRGDLQQYSSNLKKGLYKAFPEYLREGTKDFEVVTKVTSTLTILAGLDPSQKETILAHIQSLKKLLLVTIVQRQTDTLGIVNLGIQVAQSREAVTAKEIVKIRTHGVSSSPHGSSVQDVELLKLSTGVRENLKRLHVATTGLKEISAIQWNPMPDHTSIPMVGNLLSTAKRELEDKILAFYTELASNPDIMSFLALRLFFIPFNRGTAQ